MNQEDYQFYWVKYKCRQMIKECEDMLDELEGKHD